MNQAAKAKQSEAKQAIGALNRGQQAYRLENVEFAPSIALLALGLDTDTNNYGYGTSTSGTPTAPASSADGNFDGSLDSFATTAQIFADAKDDAAVRSYLGAVAASVDPEGNATTITALCEGLKPGDGPLVDYTAADSSTTPPTAAILACDTSVSKQL